VWCNPHNRQYRYPIRPTCVICRSFSHAETEGARGGRGVPGRFGPSSLREHTRRAFGRIVHIASVAVYRKTVPSRSRSRRPPEQEGRTTQQAAKPGMSGTAFERHLSSESACYPSSASTHFVGGPAHSLSPVRWFDSPTF